MLQASFTVFGSYSSDGRWIVFRLEDHGRFGLCMMRPDGSHPRVILGLSNFSPGFIDWGANTQRSGAEPEHRGSATTATTTTRRAIAGSAGHSSVRSTPTGPKRDL